MKPFRTFVRPVAQVRGGEQQGCSEEDLIGGESPSVRAFPVKLLISRAADSRINQRLLQILIRVQHCNRRATHDRRRARDDKPAAGNGTRDLREFLL